jgi:hypothetical protein
MIWLKKKKGRKLWSTDVNDHREYDDMMGFSKKCHFLPRFLVESLYHVCKCVNKILVWVGDYSISLPKRCPWPCTTQI